MCDASQGYKCFEVLEDASEAWDTGTLRVYAYVTAQDGVHVIAGPRTPSATRVPTPTTFC